MNTKILMIASSLVMGFLGICFTFLPGEILGFSGVEPADLNTLFLQITGSLYFAFAMLNWMAKGNLIGGIYSKPVAIGNFTHFMVGGLLLSNSAFSSPENIEIWIAAIGYSILAVLFGWVSFGNPLKAEK